MSSTDCTNPRIDAEEPGALLVRDAMVSSPKAMAADGTVADLRAMFENPHVRTALLVDGAEFVGVVHRDAVAGDAADGQPARDLADRDVPTVEPDAPLEDAMEIFEATGDNRLVVLDPDGATLRGLLCLKRDRRSFCKS